jgi:hypothetical protein
MRTMRMRRTVTAAVMAVVLAVSTLAASGLGTAASAAAAPRIELKVLVVSDGSAWTDAIRAQLASEGVPVTVISLADSSRPVITSSLLSGTLSDGTAVGHYQGVVLPNDAPSGLSAAELTALASYETAFSVRQVDGYLYPTGNVGVNAPVYGGSLDGTKATVTAAAKAAGFGYLTGSLSFDGTPGGSGSYGYLAQPQASTATSSFAPFLTAPVPGGSGTGVLAGVYTSGGRQQLELSFGYNYYQLQYRYLAHGIVDWLTRGVHLGYWRNYLTVDLDDVFTADAQWSQSGHCTPGDSACPAGTPDTSPIRMTPADVSYARQWQQQHNFTLEFLYNGGSSARFQVNGTDPLLAAFKPVASQFRWVNHTFTHQDLGCVPDFTVTPWRCQTDASGSTVWASAATINSEINQNITWARQNGIPIDASELATGEYSGLRILPQQPVDNPSLVSALGPDKISWLAMDASREPAMRAIGPALGLPRHPVDVFYNVATQADQVSEYNWIYDSTADGGSGLCQGSAAFSCLQPLSLTAGWTSFILPLQVKTMLGALLQNDPRPFYMHQSNLTGDRLAYPVVTGVLDAYASVFAANTPVVNSRMSADGAALQAQGLWASALAAGNVSGYVQGATVTITGPSGTSVPVTAPTGTRVSTASGAAYGSSYAAERSAYTTLGSKAMTLVLPSVAYPAGPAAAPATAATTPATRSTRAISNAVNPAQPPGGKLGTAVRQATGGATGPASTGSASTGGR